MRMECVAGADGRICGGGTVRCGARDATAHSADDTRGGGGIGALRAAQRAVRAGTTAVGCRASGAVMRGIVGVRQGRRTRAVAGGRARAEGSQPTQADAEEFSRGESA